MWRTAAIASLCHAADAKIVDFEVHGGALGEVDHDEAWTTNRNALQTTLASLEPGDTLVIPNRTYYIGGGIRVDNVKGVTIQIDGTLSYASDQDSWPRKDESYKGGSNRVEECFYGEYWEDVTFTSSGRGTFDGRGANWWGFPGIGYLELGENRPRLMSLHNGKGLLFENIMFKDSPYWTFWVTNVDGLEVRNCEIDARRDHTADHHDIIELSAFNTDGFDVTGKNVWIHDCKIWNQDDCIAAKDNSQDMVFERIEASGLGMTIGSIGSSTVRNITFRDIYMKNTVKGIYAKFRGGAGVIEDVVFENIVMDSPSQYAIWIGPAQQSDSSNPCAAHPCSLCWPQAPGATCNGVDEAKYSNILLRNITVNDVGTGKAGVIVAGASNPMDNVVFEDVVFNNLKLQTGLTTFDDFYHVQHVNGVAKGRTWPVPPGFQDETGTCQSDGACKADGFSCCSTAAHKTMSCDSGKRCGCVEPGTCATHKSDCCSGVGHKTAACSLGIGYRCDSETTV